MNGPDVRMSQIQIYYWKRPNRLWGLPNFRSSGYQESLPRGQRPGREINYSSLVPCCRMHGIIRTCTPCVAFMEWQGLRNCL